MKPPCSRPGTGQVIEQVDFCQQSTLRFRPSSGRGRMAAFSSRGDTRRGRARAQDRYKRKGEKGLWERTGRGTSGRRQLPTGVRRQAQHEDITGDLCNDHTNLNMAESD